MSGMSLFITPRGIIIADGGDVGKAIVTRLEQSIATGEASGFVVNTVNDAAPFIEMYNDAQFAVDFAQANLEQDVNKITRDLFAAAVGTLAGMIVAVEGPGAALAADAGVSKYKDAMTMPPNGRHPKTGANFTT